jgi:hypothetical protein
MPIVGGQAAGLNLVRKKQKTHVAYAIRVFVPAQFEAVISKLACR